MLRTLARTAATRAQPRSFAIRFASSGSEKPRVLVTGSVGQIGSELVTALRSRYGEDHVIATDVKYPPKNFASGPFHYLDVLDRSAMAKLVVENRIDCVVHLASLLSAVGEKNPQLAMKLNTRGIENVLELARLNNLRVFAPSTIAVFGPSTPRDSTPQETIMRPTTIYGVTKVYLELLGEYYYNKFGVDFRSVRYPGIISNQAMPGGGTTDYAVEIYHEAIKNHKYECFLKENTEMPMMYMPDAVDATIALMEASAEKLTQRTYNLTGFSFTPKQLAQSLQKVMPDFQITYKPDFRQDIADSWPKSIDDSAAKKDWDWNPKYTIDTMTVDMFTELKKKYAKEITDIQP